MKTILLLLLAIPSLVLAQKTGVIYDTKVIRINDGDTVVISAPYLPKPLKPELSLRIYGVDTPEKGYRAKCASEDSLGKTATQYTRMQISKAKTHQVVLYEWDKYGGRILGDLILDGQSLRQLLITSGYARAYDGNKKSSWCN